MILVTGGAYQGKLEYAEKTYGLGVVEAVDFMTEGSGQALIISGMEKFVLWCVGNDMDPVSELGEACGLLENKVIVCSDISAGVVPVDPHMRRWREANGQTLVFLAEKADTVIRMFCGIPQKLK